MIRSEHIQAIEMKVLVVVLLFSLVNVTPSTCSVAAKFKEFEIIPDILDVAPSKLLEVGKSISLSDGYFHRSGFLNGSHWPVCFDFMQLHSYTKII